MRRYELRILPRKRVRPIDEDNVPDRGVGQDDLLLDDDGEYIVDTRDRPIETGTTP